MPGTQVIPQPGDFRIVPVAGWAGLGIEIGQFLNHEGWSHHDHAEVYLGALPGKDGLWTASSYSDGPGIRPFEAIDGDVWSTGVIALTDEQRAGIVQWCLEHPDVGYSWITYLALALHRFGINDPALRRYIASTKHLICSAYTDAAFNYGGDVHLFQDGRWESYVTPGDLASLVTGEGPAT